MHANRRRIQFASRGREVGNPYHGEAGRRVAKAPTWACRSVGRSLPWHGRGPEFKSRHVHSSDLDSKQWSGLCCHKLATQHFGQVCRLGPARPPIYRMKSPFRNPVKSFPFLVALPAKSLIKKQGALQSWQKQPRVWVPSRHRPCPRCVPYLRSPNFVNASNSKHRACTSKARCLPSKHCSMRLGCGSMQVKARYRFEHRPLGNLLTRATGC